MNQEFNQVNLQWNASQPAHQDGVITGCNETMEWMLKWWWKHYSATNDLPVTFLDFGLSKSARMWCEKRMHVIACPIPKQFEKEARSFPLPTSWSVTWREKRLTERKFWFTKICSLLKTPYSRSLWVDIDCKFLEKIDAIFDMCNNPNGIALGLDTKETITSWKKLGLLKKKAKGYQAGLILFKKGSPFIEKWALCCQKEYTIEYADQTLLNSIIERDNIDIFLIPEQYHWLYPNYIPEGVRLIHYAGGEAKHWIIKEMETV